MTLQVAIVGGGIAGLAAAVHVRQALPDAQVMLLESNGRLGGVLNTTRDQGYLLEDAADGFLSHPPHAIDLCERFGLADSLHHLSAAQRKAFVVHRGCLQAVPEGFTVLAPSRLWPIIASPVLSPLGKLRAACELFLPPRRSIADESLQSFVSRRFGREVYERLAQPLVSGIYSADPARLSVEASLPRFRQLERDHGSLLRGLMRSRSRSKTNPAGQVREPQFVAPAEGMASLVRVLESSLPQECVRVNSPVAGIIPLSAGRWLVAVRGPQPQAITADAVILATPAYQTASLLETLDPQLAGELSHIEYASCAVVGLGYLRDQIRHPLNGVGFVVPAAEQRLILSCSFASMKYPGRAPEGSVLLRVFIGGACQAGLLRFPRAQLIELATREVADLLQIRGEPQWQSIVRHRRALPQYHVGHADLVSRIQTRLKRYPTLSLAGSSLEGVGVPSCILSGERAAQRVASTLAQTAFNEFHFANR